MNGPLERRLERLEAASGVGVDGPVIFVSFVSPAGAAPHETATVDGHAWHRAPEEPEAAFLERVGAEARHSRPGVVVVAFLDWRPRESLGAVNSVI
jgi:hypothetical protein